MAWSKPIGEVELAYIEKEWPRLSCAEIARKLGRSTRGVENAVNRLGLRERRAPAPARATPADDNPAPSEPLDEAAELRVLKKMLKAAMREAGPQSMPKLSAEYREVIRRIGEVEGDSGGKQSSELAGIIGFVPVRTP